MTHTYRNTLGAVRFAFLAAVGAAVCSPNGADAAPLEVPVGYTLSICESLEVLKHPNDAQAAMMAAWQTPAQLAMERSQPFLVLENTKFDDSTGTAELRYFYMTIGDKENDFDWAKIIKTDPGVTAEVLSPDTVNGGEDTQRIQIKFTGLTPGKKVYFQIDIDPEGNLLQFGDYRTVLFKMNGGPNTSGNSKTAASFWDPSLPDGFKKLITPSHPWDNPIVTFPTTIGLEPRDTYQMDHVQPFNTGNVGMMPVPEPNALALAGLGGVGLALYGRHRSRKNRAA